MSNPNQSVRTCKLKVDLKCCTGCQKKASTKLQTISGVSEVEYNAEKGLMTVTGDVEPMTLVHKLTRWGKKAELVSVNYQLDDDDLLSDSEEDENDDDEEEEEWDTDAKPMERETQATTMQKKKKKGILRKSSLLGCFSSSKPKVNLPFPTQNQNRQRLFPHMLQQLQPRPHPMMYPQQMMQQQQQRQPFPMMNHQPMMQQPQAQMMWPQQPQAQMMWHQQQQPQRPMMGAPMPMVYNGNMFQQAPPPTRPYFQKDLKVNPTLHYQKS